MTYIRHRDRMVQSSVYEDLVDTLIAGRWLAGTTTRAIVDPLNPGNPAAQLTVTQADVLKLVGAHPIKVIDYFPEATGQGEAGTVGDGGAELNTLAMDDGQAGEPNPLELGSTAVEIPYRFNLAFWAASTGLAQALLNDLRDRYRGLWVKGDFVTLYDYNTDPDAPVLGMGVESFTYLRSVEEEASPHEVTMYYAQLTVLDEVD